MVRKSYPERHGEINRKCRGKRIKDMDNRARRSQEVLQGEERKNVKFEDKAKIFHNS